MNSSSTDLKQELQTLDESQFNLINVLKDEYEKGFMAINSLGAYSVTFYGGHMVDEQNKAYLGVKNLATAFGQHGWGVVSGGGPGIMKAALEGAREGGGKAIAFCIQIADEQDATKDTDISLSFSQFSARKYMLRQSDAFIFAPGGLGTLDELMEVLTLIHTNKHPKKPIFLFDSDFWKGYVDWFEEVLYKERKVVGEDFNQLFNLVDTTEDVTKILFE